MLTALLVILAFVLGMVVGAIWLGVAAMKTAAARKKEIADHVEAHADEWAETRAKMKAHKTKVDDRVSAIRGKLN